MKTDYSTWLTPEQKAAFAKGDDYYVSPFKDKYFIPRFESKSKAYHSTSYSQIHCARVDSWASKSWN